MTRVLVGAARFINALRRLILPTRAVCGCCGCETGQDADWLCAACAEALDASRLAGDALPMDGYALLAAHSYRGAAARMVRQMKYPPVWVLAEWMTRDMAARFFGSGAPTPDLLAPVPMNRVRERFRGGNHAELLARGLEERLGIPLVLALRRTRHTKRQARLPAAKRRVNLTGAFRADERVRGKSVLLIDDVHTTGSTAMNCARALLDAGAVSVLALTFAITTFNLDGSASK